MTEQSTVRSVTYDLLRTLQLTTVSGHPGSTEQPFLQDFPEDFTYVLAPQEASVIAMADAFAQVTRRPALVNVHSSAGPGNAMGNLIAAYHGNTPLIVTSGQQHRELVIGDPYLGNRQATTLPKPWVKWSYEPEEYGLVNELTPPGAALDVARELAGRVARNAPLALAAVKEVLRETQGLNESDAFRRQDELTSGLAASEARGRARGCSPRSVPPSGTAADAGHVSRLPSPQPASDSQE
jgi:hypothetical protein